MDATAWAIALLFVGLLFLVLEFFIPSAGILAALCAICLVAAVILGFSAGPATGISIVLAIGVLVPLSASAAVRWWPDTPFGKLMLVQRPRTSDDVLPETVEYRGLKGLIGLRGQARNLMLPSGAVLIDGKTYDAVSEGVAIEAGAPIVVVAVSTQRLVVRPDTTIVADFADEPAPGAGSPAPGTSSPSPKQALIDNIPDPFAE